jgi:hypothetical protein
LASQAAWDREQEIVDEAGGGELVFADVLVTHWKKIVIEDPAWRPDYEIVPEGGFDHGKTNPTCLLRAYVEFDGTIVYAGEYYQPGMEIWQHSPRIKMMAEFHRMDRIYADRTIFPSTQQQEQRPGHAQEVAKSLNELYCDQGIESFVPFVGDRSDVSFVNRLHLHWSNLADANKMSTVRIFCPRGMYADKPVPGLCDWGCPNLLWELMNTRRVNLTAQQLLSRNLSEAIVDKDNHARDAMKYHLMSKPEPGRKSLERRVAERMQEAAKIDPTAAVAQYSKIMREESEGTGTGVYRGPNLRRRILEEARRRFAL